MDTTFNCIKYLEEENQWFNTVSMISVILTIMATIATIVSIIMTRVSLSSGEDHFKYIMVRLDSVLVNTGSKVLDV